MSPNTTPVAPSVRAANWPHEAGAPSAWSPLSRRTKRRWSKYLAGRSTGEKGPRALPPARSMSCASASSTPPVLHRRSPSVRGVRNWSAVWLCPSGGSAVVFDRARVRDILLAHEAARRQPSRQPSQRIPIFRREKNHIAHTAAISEFA